MSTLKTALESLPDHRHPQGREYALSSLLLLVLAGFLCGCNSLLAVWRFGKRLTREQKESLGFLWFKLPSHPTLCVTLKGLDVAALEAALSGVVLSAQSLPPAKAGDGEPLHLSIDGKALRGSKTTESPKGAQMLACFSDKLKGVIGQKATKGGHDEVTAAIALLKELPLKGTVITGDAMFADRHLCETIIEGGGNYLFPLKDNQPSLKRAALAAVGKKALDTHEETRTGHGRIDHRKIELALVGHVRWPGLKQWGRITRTRTNKKTGEVTIETVCFISSLGVSQATAAQLLHYNRHHWSIENCLHRNKDVLLKEDASTVRSGNAPQALAAIRNLTLHQLARLDPSPTVAREIAQNDRNMIIQMII